MYTQITSDERYKLLFLLLQGLNQSEIARVLGRHPSTISREIRRNTATSDGFYGPHLAQLRVDERRSRSRRNSHFSASDMACVEALLKQDYSPEQAAGQLRLDGTLQISHETIYRHVWQDKVQGGQLWRHMRCSRKYRRRYRSYKRPRAMPNKRRITERPAVVETRQELGHWEIDTVIGSMVSRHCVVTMVERASGMALIGKLEERTMEAVNECVIRLVDDTFMDVLTVTSDNGSEFHGYQGIEAATGATFYFANPHHAWERGSNENFNGLLRQYLPKGRSMEDITQEDCDLIAHRLNTRPRKRHGFRNALEVACGL